VAPEASSDKVVSPLKRARKKARSGGRSDATRDGYLRALEEISRRRPIKGATTEEIMAKTRGESTPPPAPAAPRRRGVRS
jgi:hypothetical protein